MFTFFQVAYILMEEIALYCIRIHNGSKAHCHSMYIQDTMIKETTTSVFN